MHIKTMKSEDQTMMQKDNVILPIAIALNNIGVRMLERHCYQQALFTMIDAISLMRLAVVTSNEESVSTAIYKEANEKYHLALQRLSQPLPCKTATGITTDVLVTNRIDLELVQSNVPDAAFSLRTVYPICIEDYDVIDYTLDNENRDTESGILLYNLALTHYCLSQSLDRLPHKSKDQKNAIRLLRMSHSLYCKRENELSELSDNSTIYPEFLKLKAIILSTLIKLLNQDTVRRCTRKKDDADCCEELQSHCSIIKHLILTIQELERTQSLNSIFEASKNTAAAA